MYNTYSENDINYDCIYQWIFRNRTYLCNKHYHIRTLPHPRSYSFTLSGHTSPTMATTILTSTTSQSSLIYPIISLLWVPYTLIGHPLGQASFMSQDQWFPMFKAHTFFPRCVQLAKLLTPSRLCHPRQPQTSSGFSWKKVVTSHYMHTSQTPVDTPLALVRTLQLHPTSMPLPGVQLSRHSTRK